MPSDFRGSHFFLTYSQNAFDLDTDFGEFSTWLERTTGTSLKYLLVGCEKHADGGDHWHAVVSFDKRMCFGPRALDYRDVHPNVKLIGRRVLDWDRCVQYTKKDGKFLDMGTPRHGTESVWAALVKAQSRDEALQLVQADAPRDFVLNRRNLDYALDKMWPVQEASHFQPRPAEAFRIPDDLVRWVSGSLVYA